MSTITLEQRQQCRHIFTDGHRCGSPCLRQVSPQANSVPGRGHEPFCYYHHTSRPPIATTTRTHRTRRASQSTAFTLSVPEDRAAIQLSIGEVLRRIALGEIDPRRAGLLLYGLQIASLNLPRTRPAAEPQDSASTPIVEETTDDPILGRLALPATLPGPKAEEKGSAQLLLEELESLCHARDARLAAATGTRVFVDTPAADQVHP